MEKTDLRKKLLAKREVLTTQKKMEKDEKIANHLELLGVFREASHILFYYSRKGEVDTLRLMEKWLKQKNLFLPRLISENTFVPLPFSSFEDLEVNRFGIPEPPMIQDVEAALNLIIVPGVAFDRSGNRIGMGKGFYDRFLAQHKDVPKVALAFEEQILDQLPKEPYDESVDIIVTDSEIFYINPASKTLNSKL